MIKIILLTIASAIMIIYLRSINKELSFLATIGVSIVLLIYSAEFLTDSFYFINKLVELSGIDKNYYKIILKIISIGYLVEFSADLINDFGLQSLSNKIIFIGKIVILSVASPIIYGLFNIITGILQ